MRMKSHIMSAFKVKYLRNMLARRFQVYRSLHHRGLKAALTASEIVTWVMSFICLGGAAAFLGFDHTADRDHEFRLLLHIPQTVFIINVLLGMILRQHKRRFTFLGRAVDLAVLLTILPWIYPRPDTPWIQWLDQVLYSRYFLVSVLGTYSVLELCRAVMTIPGKHTNPALLLAGSFLFVIVTGSFLLMLPRCTVHPISYVDSLFISTSAVSITGLTPLDVSSAFTLSGRVILLAMMQIGAIGVMTVTCFFALSFTGKSSLFSQLLIRDIIYSRSMGSLVPTMLGILGFTIAVELAGAVMIYFTIPESMGFTVAEQWGVALFQSVSSYCNAGFTCLPEGMSNPKLLYGDQSIYAVTSLLVFMGTIGFPIVINIWQTARYRVIRLLSPRRKQASAIMAPRMLDLNSRLVLVTTVSILAASTILFFILEYDNSLAPFSVPEKLLQSLFNSLTPRSAGFQSVSINSFLPLTMILIVVQMWIGGSSQSFAGGMKVNTVAVIFLHLKGVIRGEKAPVAYDRRISGESVSRAFAVLLLAIGSFLAFAILLLAFEPDKPVKAILFETVSAVFTVGSSTGITSELGDASRITLCVAMFLGRVGFLSLLCGLFSSGKPSVCGHLPEENVIMN